MLLLLPFVVAKPGGTAKLKELVVRLRDVEVVDPVPGSGGSATARGSFVIVRATIANLTSSPQDIGTNQDQTRLGLGDEVYSEDFDAQKGAVSDSFLSRSPLKIQPDEKLDGAWVYDIPDRPTKEIRAGGGELYVANFSDSDADDAQEVAALPLGAAGR